MPMKLLEGEAIDPAVDDRDARIDDLEAELQATKNDLRRAQAFARDAQANAAAALAPLRRQLTPLYKALQQVFGDLDAAGVEDVGSGTTPTAPTSRVSAVWENWKAKLGPGPAKVIDALLLHGDMNTQQLAIACGCSRHTIPDHVYKLNKAGLINKQGGRFSLKAL